MKLQLLQLAHIIGEKIDSFLLICYTEKNNNIRRN